MSNSYVDISAIFQKQKEILEEDPQNRWYFVSMPLWVGFFCSALFYTDTKSIIGILSLFLSIFIPLFVSLLATMISFVMNKVETRHNKERIPLIKQTFYNICYLIPISLILLVLSLFMSLSLGDKTVAFEWSINIDALSITKKIGITYHFIYIFLLGILFYGGIIHLLMNILMITKRIFKLFDKEIDLWTQIKLNEVKKQENIAQSGRVSREPSEDDEDESDEKVLF